MQLVQLQCSGDKNSRRLIAVDTACKPRRSLPTLLHEYIELCRLMTAIHEKCRVLHNTALCRKRLAWTCTSQLLRRCRSARCSTHAALKGEVNSVGITERKCVKPGGDNACVASVHIRNGTYQRVDMSRLTCLVHVCLARSIRSGVLVRLLLA